MKGTNLFHTRSYSVITLLTLTIFLSLNALPSLSYSEEGAAPKTNKAKKTKSSKKSKADKKKGSNQKKKAAKSPTVAPVKETKTPSDSAPSNSKGTLRDIKKNILTVRETLVGMLKDPAKRTPEQGALVKASADKVTTLIDSLQVGPDQASKYETMKKTWGEFKVTREAEVVPLIKAGKIEEAQKLVFGIQKDRLKVVLDTCDELSGRDF